MSEQFGHKLHQQWYCEDLCTFVVKRGRAATRERWTPAASFENVNQRQANEVFSIPLSGPALFRIAAKFY